jgi:hypothetical protein
MKTLRNLKSILTCAGFLLATSAFAANQGSLNVTNPESVAGERLPAGQYKVRWEGTGPSVELSIMRGKKVVATVPAVLVPLHDPSLSDSVVVLVDAQGSRRLTQIFLSGKRVAVEIVGETASVSSNTSK